MADYIISTDTGSDLTEELYTKYDIRPLKMEYEVDGKVYEDTFVGSELDAFYNSMRDGACPKTTQLNITKLEAFFTELASEGKPIIYLSLGSGISGSYNNACNAAKEVSEKTGVDIHVVDSSVASLGGGMLCLRASDNRAKGMSVEENIADIDAVKHNIVIYFTTKDLTYLHRGGRVSSASKVLGHMLGINPILTLDFEGHLKVHEKARGDKGTYDRIEKLVGEGVIDPTEQVLYISQADAMEKAVKYGDALKAKYGFKDVVITNIGTIIGAHTGPGLVAMFCVGKTRNE